ncbi:hypothetical protein FRC03_010840 [Tulasnella sp. 419]|nr:hypothetical protein FRC03_010840 [Tulasnella sp. 419]
MLEPNGRPLESSNPSSSPAETIKNSSIFWDHYIKEADLYDTEMVKGMTGDLDTLLIFAGLFSAVNTVFIVEAYKDLKPDPMEATNALILQLLQNTVNGTSSGPEINGPSFVAPTGSVRACQLFFSSLSCSLLAAFGAMLGKQWLNEYQRYGKQRSPLARGIQRHGKFLGMDKYHFMFVIQTLPTLLQFSLFLFLVGLVEFLWLIHSHVAAVVIGFLGAAFLLWFITTLISTFDSTSPFSTRLSAQLHRLVKKKKNETTNTAPSGAVTIVIHADPPSEDSSSSSSSEDNPPSEGNAPSEEDNKFLRLASDCIAWMKRNATTFNSAGAMASTAILLPKQNRDQKNLSGEEVGQTFITSVLSSNAIEHGIWNGTLNSTLRILLEVVRDWKPSFVDSMMLSLVNQLHTTLRFIASNDHSSSELIIKILGEIASGVYIYHLPSLDMNVLKEVFKITSLDRSAQRVSLRFLWSQMKKMEDEAVMELMDTSWFKEIPTEFLENTMWLDANNSIHDPDEEMMEFRQLWYHFHIIKSERSTDYLPYRRTLQAFSSYVRSWVDANPTHVRYPSALLVSEMVKVVMAMRGGIWGLSNAYPFSLGVPAKTFAEDGHISGAMEWVSGQSNLQTIEILSPCYWAYQVSEVKDPVTVDIPIPDSYVRAVIAVLQQDDVLKKIGKELYARVGLEVGGFAMYSIWYALCWLIKKKNAVPIDGTAKVLHVLREMGTRAETSRKRNGSISVHDVNETLREIAVLCQEHGSSFLEELKQDAAAAGDQGDQVIKNDSSTSLASGYSWNPTPRPAFKPQSSLSTSSWRRQRS